LELDDRVYTPPLSSLYVLNTISEVEEEEGSLCGPASFLHLPPHPSGILYPEYTHTQEEEIQQRRSTITQRKKRKEKKAPSQGKYTQETCHIDAGKRKC
jgi:hypothetical protein